MKNITEIIYQFQNKIADMPFNDEINKGGCGQFAMIIAKHLLKHQIVKPEQISFEIVNQYVNNRQQYLLNLDTKTKNSTQKLRKFLCNRFYFHHVLLKIKFKNKILYIDSNHLLNKKQFNQYLKDNNLYVVKVNFENNIKPISDVFDLHDFHVMLNTKSLWSKTYCIKEWNIKLHLKLKSIFKKYGYV